MYKESTLSFGLIAEFFLTLGYGPIEYVLWAGFAVAVLPTVMVLRAL